jgi:hypothetical protein
MQEKVDQIEKKLAHRQRQIEYTVELLELQT